MQSIFGPAGLIAKAHPEYEHRPGQIDMAEAVLPAVEQKQHLIVEAGTGTGKTLAYLVPAISPACCSGARVGSEPGDARGCRYGKAWIRSTNSMKWFNGSLGLRQAIGLSFQICRRIF